MDIVLKSSKPKSSINTLAIFDYDGTLVKAKDGRPFPKDVNDWQLLRESVADFLRGLNDYQIVIMTDQSKLWKIEQIKNVMKEIGVEYTALIGMKTHKPNTSFFDKKFPSFNKKDSFYVGDAGGRVGNWSDVDKKFAEAIGVDYFTPEETFPLPEIVIPKTATAKKKKEVIIMVGYPASGKTTIAKTVLKDYYRVDGDSLKTAKKMIKNAKEHVDKQSIVFDSTAGTRAKRAEFVAFAKEYDLPVRVFWVKTPIDVAMERNKERGDAKIPAVVYYVYRKKFEEPVEEEGFKVVKI